VVVACILDVPRDFPFVAPSVGLLEVSITSEVIVDTVGRTSVDFRELIEKVEASSDEVTEELRPP